MGALGIPEFHGLRHVHQLKFCRHDGIHVCWKQWMTDEHWSKPHLLVPAEEMREVAAVRPTVQQMDFPEAEKTKVWLDKLEVWAAAQEVPGYQSRIAWLRGVVDHTASDCMGGLSLDHVLAEIRNAGSCRTADSLQMVEFPPDITTQLCPGGDVPHIPADALLAFGEPDSLMAHQNIVVPGSMLIVKMPMDFQVHETAMPFLLAMALELSLIHISEPTRPY